MTIAVALLALTAVAGTLSYAGFLVVGTLADYLGTGRLIAGLLLGVLFARVPRFRKGKLSTVGLLPKSVRRPLMMALLALCLLSFLYRGDYVPAVLIGLATAFLLTFPWLRRTIWARVLSSLLKASPKQNRQDSISGNVIDVEFREMKD